MTSKKPVLAPFLTAKRKAPPVTEPEEIEDADYEESSALAYSPGMEDDEDDTDEVEDGEEDKEPRYHDDPPEEAIGEQEEDPTKEVPKKCVREGCKHPRVRSPRKSQYTGLCKSHRDSERAKAIANEKHQPPVTLTPDDAANAIEYVRQCFLVVEELGGLPAARRAAKALKHLKEGM